MSFVVSTGNKQYLVKNGQIVIVDKLDAEVDSIIELEVLHALGETKATKTIKATVLNHQKGEKIRVVKYRAKSNYHRQYGFRPHETVLKIEGVFATEKSSELTSKSKIVAKPSTKKSELKGDAVEKPVKKLVKKTTKSKPETK